MTNRGDPEGYQVLGRQLRKRLSLDVVVTESRCVLLQPKAPQPYRDVHAPPPIWQRALLCYYIPIANETSCSLQPAACRLGVRFGLHDHVRCAAAFPSKPGIAIGSW